jgi:hypothetical protein
LPFNIPLRSQDFPRAFVESLLSIASFSIISVAVGNLCQEEKRRFGLSHHFTYHVNELIAPDYKAGVKIGIVPIYGPLQID